MTLPRMSPEVVMVMITRGDGKVWYQDRNEEGKMVAHERDRHGMGGGQAKYSCGGRLLVRRMKRRKVQRKTEEERSGCREGGWATSVSSVQ